MQHRVICPLTLVRIC